MLLRTLIASLMLLLFSTQSYALVYVVNEATDLFNPVGNIIVAGNNESSGTGQNYEVLKFKPQGNNTSGTASDGSPLDQAPHGDVKISDLWSHLNSNGITSTYVLVFGFDLNQAQFDHIDINSLSITVGNQDFTIGQGNVVRVYDYQQSGSSVAEAKFQINLGYDFMKTYSAASADEFIILASHSSADGGFDEYFLSAAFTANPPVPVQDQNTVIPEPSSMLLLGSGLLAFARIRRFKG